MTTVENKLRICVTATHGYDSYSAYLRGSVSSGAVSNASAELVRRRKSMGEDVHVVPKGWMAESPHMRPLLSFYSMRVAFVTPLLGSKRTASEAETPSAGAAAAAAAASGHAITTYKPSHLFSAVSLTVDVRSMKHMTLEEMLTQAQSVSEDMDDQRKVREQRRQTELVQGLMYATRTWRSQHPELVMVQKHSGEHRCTTARELRRIERAQRPLERLKKREKRVGDPDHVRKLPTVSCCQTHLIVRCYASGHVCVHDTRTQQLLCDVCTEPEPVRTAAHARLTWTDETLYMCSYSGWAHRCGNTCTLAKEDEEPSSSEDEAEHQPQRVKERAYVVCPISGLCLDNESRFKNDFWQPEDGEDTTNNSHSGRKGASSGGGTDEQTLYRIFDKHGDMRKNGGKLLLQSITLQDLRTTWVQQLVLCKNVHDMRTFAAEQVELVAKKNLHLAYLMLAMCDVWAFFDRERYALERQRQLRVAQEAAAAVLRLVSQHQTQWTQSCSPRPLAVTDMEQTYYAAVCDKHFAPALDPAVAADFVVKHAELVVKFWYVLHTRVLPPRGEGRPVPEQAIAFEQFTHAALYVIASGIVVPSLTEGTVDQVVITPQPALAFMLPRDNVLQQLVGDAVRTNSVLRSDICNMVAQAITNQTVMLHELDFARLEFEQLNLNYFYSITLRERHTATAATAAAAAAAAGALVVHRRRGGGGGGVKHRSGAAGRQQQQQQHQQQ